MITHERFCLKLVTCCRFRQCMLNFLETIFNHVLYRSVANNFKIPTRFQLLKSKYFAGKGYVFASSKFSWQSGFTDTISPLKVKHFLSSLEGNFKPGISLQEASQLCSCMYLVTVTTAVQPSYQCNCKAFYHFTECSHVVAAKTLEKVFSLNDKISSISRAKLRGRPRKYTPVGFAAHVLNDEQQQELTTQMARNTIGGAVATVKGARVYTGKVTAYVKNADTAKFNFNVHFPRQFDDDNAQIKSYLPKKVICPLLNDSDIK